VLAQGETIVPIFGTKRRTYLDENLRALDVQLTVEDLRRIDDIAPPGVAAGARYPETMQRLVSD
jgi:aryl-alcohol dehydrogenase-like predicted oxidoreductase